MPLTITFLNPGNFTIDDDGTPGNGTSVIRNADGDVIFTFAHPADELTFLTTTPGVHLTVNITDSLGAADFTIGNLTDPADSPDSIVAKNIRTSGAMTLVSNGSITEGGSDSAVDLQGGSMIISAVSGVGTSANAIETQTSVLEAETTTGGLALDNVGAVQIGGLTDEVQGLNVVTSGDIFFSNLGSISLGDLTGAQSVRGGTSGNVTLIANGFDSSIVGVVNRDSISVPGGDLTLTAALDIALGTNGANFDNDVRAAGSITVNAGRDFLIDGFADMESDNFGTASGGGIVINAGRTIGLLDNTGTDAGVLATGTSGADVVLTTGAGGSVILNAQSPLALGSLSGDVIVNADRLLISNASGISANNGTVTLRPATVGREIAVGSLSDGLTALEISDDEIDRITADKLVIGSGSAGLLLVDAPITPLNVPMLELRTGSDLNLSSSLTVTDSILLSAGDNINQLAASTITTTILDALVGQEAGDGEGGGTNNFLGTLSISSLNLSGGDDRDILIGTLGADVVSGGGGSDTLLGDGGNDMLDGGSGGDHLNGGNGADTMSGGADNDLYRVNNVGDVVIEMGGGGKDRVLSTISYRLTDSVERLLLLGGGDLSGRGNSADNEIIGNSGDNFLSGYSGDDRIEGGDGDDTIIGGLGLDILIGGSGEDDFLFNTKPAKSNTDRIYDFETGTDRFVLDQDVFPQIGAGTLSAAAFHLGATAQDANDRILYDDSTGKIFYDRDGSGSAAAILFAAVSPGTALAHSDFFVAG